MIGGLEGTHPVTPTSARRTDATGARLSIGALSRATLLHDVGHLESGMQSALEGMVLGDEIAGYARAFLGDLSTDDDAVALDEIMAVGPGGDHLARRMTRERHRGFWQADLTDQQTYERWRAAGALPLLARVRERLRELRAAPPPFALDPSITATLAEMVEAWRDDPGRGADPG